MMTHKSIAHALVLAVSLGSSFVYGQSTSQGRKSVKSRLTPATIKQIQTANKGYKQCQNEVALEVKPKNLSQDDMRQQMKRCEDTYPGAALYVACKRRKLTESKGLGSKGLQKADLEECRMLLNAGMFDPKSPVPFAIEDGKIFFAGIGLNESQRKDTLELPNFECGKIKEMTRAADGSFMLFGNSPASFIGWSKANPFKLHGRSQSTRVRVVEPYGEIVGFGSQALLYFPVSACDFSGSLGEHYSGLSIYYLMDLESNQITPYFGVAYYRPGQKLISVRAAIHHTTSRLGSAYRSVAKKGGGAYFIASSPIDKFDNENDPKDLCRTPRTHSVMGVVHSNPERPTEPAYVLIANIHNLCRHGDVVSGLKASR